MVIVHLIYFLFFSISTLQTWSSLGFLGVSYTKWINGNSLDDEHANCSDDELGYVG